MIVRLLICSTLAEILKEVPIFMWLKGTIIYHYAEFYCSREKYGFLLVLLNVNKLLIKNDS